MVGVGFLALCLGTLWALFALYREYGKTWRGWPDFLTRFFPNYPVSEDAVSAELRLLSLRGSAIRESTEKVRLTLIKDAGCKTQAVCGASVLKCRGCGASLSLMEGKKCAYCGRDLDLAACDWVIAKYDIV